MKSIVHAKFGLGKGCIVNGGTAVVQAWSIVGAWNSGLTSSEELPVAIQGFLKQHRTYTNFTVLSAVLNTSSIEYFSTLRTELSSAPEIYFEGSAVPTCGISSAWQKKSRIPVGMSTNDTQRPMDQRRALGAGMDRPATCNYGGRSDANSYFR